MLSVEQVPHPHKKGVTLLLVDEEPWRECSHAVFGNTLPLPSRSDYEALEELYSNLEYQRTKGYLLRRLAMREYSSYELNDKLSSLGISQATIDRLIEECRKDGYVDDERWMNSFIAGQQRKKQGPGAVVQKLCAKGVPYQEAQRQVDALYGSPKEGIKRLLETRYGNRDLRDYKERQKVIAALIRKGYPCEDVLAVIED